MSEHRKESDGEFATAYDGAKAGPVLNGDPCEREELHTPRPILMADYFAWSDEMAKTHVQRRCPGCTLWKIWVPHG